MFPPSRLYCTTSRLPDEDSWTSPLMPERASAILTAPEWLLGVWLTVEMTMLLLLLFVWSVRSAVKEGFAVVLTVWGGEFKVHESWSKSGSWLMAAGNGVMWINLVGSLTSWLLVDGRLTGLLIADCQLLEQKTAGMLQKKKSHRYKTFMFKSSSLTLQACFPYETRCPEFLLQMDLCGEVRHLLVKNSKFSNKKTLINDWIPNLSTNSIFCK